ncbi:DUF6153 family protein [Streptomyces sp. NPDC058953]|uniref:DUF6153 family protein n=1 Tax=unclassified Streptomyces TaxID=2593676 RepID=UPI0036C4AE31
MLKGHGTHAGRLTLFLALLFGVVTMHTVGHPSSGHGGGTTQGAQAAHIARAEAGAGAVHAAEAAARGPVVLPVVRGAVPEHGTMDPTSVCLAVLGVFGCALLLVAAGAWLGRRGAAGRTPRAGVAAAIRAGPPTPPPRIRLAQLSVLRI